MNNVNMETTGTVGTVIEVTMRQDEPSEYLLEYGWDPEFNTYTWREVRWLTTEQLADLVKLAKSANVELGWTNLSSFRRLKDEEFPLTLEIYCAEKSK